VSSSLFLNHSGRSFFLFDGLDFPSDRAPFEAAFFARVEDADEVEAFLRAEVRDFDFFFNAM